MQAAWVWAALLVLVAGGLSLAERDDAPSAAPRLDRSGVDGGAAFVADTTCHACHGRQARLFRSSHHDLAMQEATEGTVLGDFGGVTFEHFGVKTLFSRKLGRFIVRTQGPGGAVRVLRGLVPVLRADLCGGEEGAFA